jgi:hypothetical protein
LIAAQRAAGEALAGTLKAQLNPSAVLPDLPAAKAALDAEMQNSSSAAAAISMVSLMASPFLISPFQISRRRNFPDFSLAPKRMRAEYDKIGPLLA